MEPIRIFTAVVASALTFSFVIPAHGSTPEPPSCADLVLGLTGSLPVDVTLVHLHTLLNQRPEFKGIFVTPGIFPLSFLRHMIELLEKHDPAFETILKVAATSGGKNYGGDLWLFMDAFVYNLLAMKPFMKEESDENILIFLDGFKQAIAERGAKLQGYGAGDMRATAQFREDLKVFMHSEFFRWYQSKRTRFQAIYTSVEAQPNLLKKPAQDLYWAYSVSRVMTKNLSAEAFRQLSSDEQNQITTVSTWWTVPRSYITVQREVPKPSMVQALLSRIGLGQGQIPPETRLVPVPNVGDLDPNDPVWLFNQVIPGSQVTLAGDHVDRGGFGNFESLALFNFLPADFNSDQRWWARSMEISGKTSRGMPKEFKGTEFIRRFKWPTSKLGWGGVNAVHLDLMRVAETDTPDGRIATLETMVSRDGKIWYPFFFGRVGDFWVRETHIDGIPVMEKCLHCHTSDGSGKVPRGALSPRPLGFTQVQQFLDVGYTNQGYHLGTTDNALIHRFLEY